MFHTLYACPSARVQVPCRHLVSKHVTQCSASSSAGSAIAQSRAPCLLQFHNPRVRFSGCEALVCCAPVMQAESTPSAGIKFSRSSASLLCLTAHSSTACASLLVVTELQQCAASAVGFLEAHGAARAGGGAVHVRSIAYSGHAGLVSFGLIGEPCLLRDVPSVAVCGSDVKIGRPYAFRPYALARNNVVCPAAAHQIHCQLAAPPSTSGGDTRNAAGRDIRLPCC